MALPEGLWTAANCAEYFQVTARHFAERIAYLPGFPGPVRLGSGRCAARRWVSTKVKAWAGEEATQAV